MRRHKGACADHVISYPIHDVIEGFVISEPRDSDGFPIFVMKPVVYSSEHYSLTIEHMIEDHCLCLVDGEEPDPEKNLYLPYLRQAFRRAKTAFEAGKKCIHLYFRVEVEVHPDYEGVYKILNYTGSDRLKPVDLMRTGD